MESTNQTLLNMNASNENVQLLLGSIGQLRHNQAKVRIYFKN